ncbi:hypothetical protein ACFU8I_41260 [Streptomyces sp. NPDC057540]|uniref:hypothetical protein n=1 Tax=Streptomyces sp. NPDC057540 TaxID=3346160 RepID=UPI0036CBAB77
MSRLTLDRVAEIRGGQYGYRTTDQLERDVRDLLAERDVLLAELGRGKDTARGESTPVSGPARAELRFAVHGTIPLLGAVVSDLEPDYYRNHYRQIGGWLPDAWSGELPNGTDCLEWAHVLGLVMPTGINVQVRTKHTADASRYMTVQWRRERPSAAPQHGSFRRPA